MAPLESFWPYISPVEFNPSIYWKKCERCLSPLVSREVAHCLVCTYQNADPMEVVLFNYKGRPIRHKDVINVFEARNGGIDVELHTGERVRVFI